MPSKQVCSLRSSTSGSKSTLLVHTLRTQNTEPSYQKDTEILKSIASIEADSIAPLKQTSSKQSVNFFFSHQMRGMWL